MESLRRQKFIERLAQSTGEKASNSQYLPLSKYNAIIATLQRILEKGPKELKDYRLQARYGLLELQGSFHLVKSGTELKIVAVEDVFDIINLSHSSTGHGGRDVVNNDLKRRYANISREQIMHFINLCEACQMKKTKTKKSIVVKPIVSNEMNSRCQVDLIDLQSQPDCDHKFILVYQDHLTKFIRLRALKTKTAAEVAYHITDIFCELGAPRILQSDNGREFANSVIKEVISLWPQCRIVHGKPRHSQSQGSVERANRDIQDKLICWLRDNETSKWSEGLRFVQFQKNSAFHSGIGRSPYEAMFGSAPKLGLTSSLLPMEHVEQLETEEQLEALLNGQANMDETEKVNEKEDEDGIDLDNEFSGSDSEHADANGGASKCCVACQEQTSGAHFCQQCNRPCHAIEPCSIKPLENEEGFGASVICALCNNRRITQEARAGAKRCQQDQAEKMKLKSAQRFEPAKIGQTVMVPIPDVDRGRADHRNVKAVVLGVEDGFYTLGTTQGKLKQVYSRNQFMVCKEAFMAASDVPLEKEISIREAARIDSVGNGQGFFKCGCTTKCQDKKCKCLKNSVKCNSKCHSSMPCCNK